MNSIIHIAAAFESLISLSLVGLGLTLVVARMQLQDPRIIALLVKHGKPEKGTAKLKKPEQLKEVQRLWTQDSTHNQNRNPQYYHHQCLL